MKEKEENKKPNVEQVANDIYKALRLVPATADHHDALRRMMEYLLTTAKEADALKKLGEDQSVTIKSLEEENKKLKTKKK